MTQPTILVPPLQHEMPFANPVAGGLYTAATVETLNDPARLAWGIEVWSVNCTEVTRFDPACGAENPDKEQVSENGPTLFDSIGVLAADECFLGRTDAESQQRATQALRLGEQVAVEEWFAERLLTDAGTAADAPAGDPPIQFVLAVGSIEAALGARGLTGVIHAPARLAALAVHLGVATKSGARFLSPLGHTWAFGGGYGDLGNTIVGTGPVVVLQSSVQTGIGNETRRNERIAIAEREVAVGYECIAVAANVA